MKCGKNSLKSIFRKDKNREYGLKPFCTSCRTQYYNENREKTRKFYLENRDKIKNLLLENRDRLIENQKLYDEENRDKISRYRCEYYKNRREKDSNFKIVFNLRSRTNTAFKSQNVRKTIKTFDLLGCSHSFFRRWIIHQLYRNMTIEI